jgi:AraC family transcriptional regulator
VSGESEAGRFFGVVINRWRVGNLHFSESVYPPSARIKRHVHQHSYFSILLHGSYRETYGANVRECGPAAAILHPPGETHEDRFSDKGGRIFRFEMADASSDLSLAQRISDPAELRNGRVRLLAARLYRESHNSDHFSSLAVESLAWEIISEAIQIGTAREESGKPPWLAHAIEHLHEALPDNLTVERIARTVGFHPVHVARVFRQHYGCTIGEYARNWRVEVASRALATSARSIAEVAAGAGFADQSHLCRTLKIQGGITPKEFRAIFRPR